MSELSVSILSPAKVVSKTKARQVQAPGALGSLGILPGHTALVSELMQGELIVDSAEGQDRTVYFISGGYLDVAQDDVTVLVDTIEKASEIDAARAEKAKQRALERLEKRGDDVDQARAQASLARAQERLSIVGRNRN